MAAQGEHVDRALDYVRTVLDSQWMPRADMDDVDRLIAKLTLSAGGGVQPLNFTAWTTVAAIALMAAGHCHEAMGERGGDT